MVPPPITIYLTTIASQPALRQRQEYLLRILQSKKIPFNSYDLASDEEAKKLWRRRAPADKQQLPGILVGGKFIGDFEEAVEYNELDQFLRRNEEWDEEFERPPPPVKPIGVPGASLPLQMTPEHIKTKILATQQQPSPLRGKAPPKPINKEEEGSRVDLGDELSGYGLQGVKVTMDELRDMIEELGLGGDEAADLVKGLADNTESKGSKGKEPETSTKEKAEVEETTASSAKQKEKDEKEEVKEVKEMKEVKEVKEEKSEADTKETEDSEKPESEK
ncbi:hypothetical protein H1R20_g15951, partial [Candolleomyces eurysporus]